MPNFISIKNLFGDLALGSFWFAVIAYVFCVAFASVSAFAFAYVFFIFLLLLVFVFVFASCGAGASRELGASSQVSGYRPTRRLLPAPQMIYFGCRADRW